jgi:class 3 adenylate cyclase
VSDLPTGTVTFLFTDIQGSTQLLQKLGDAYEVVQNRHAEILRRAIQHCDGVLIRTEGDSFFAVFPNPVQAVRATVAAQRELAAEHWPRGQLRVRMGLHTGEGKLGGDDYVGIDVNRAARLATAAHGGQVVMSDATLGLVAHGLPEGVTTRDLGDHRMKDIAHPEHVYQLVIRGLASDFPALKSLDARPNNLPRQLTSFVGRRPQVDAVSGLLHRRRFVTLTGPGGTGKTRLALQVAETVLSRFRDGIFFVDLSPTTDPQLITSAIAQALGIKEEPGRPPVETLEDHLRDLELLLVLDNFEQIVEAARVVEQLLRAAAGLRVVVTSRVTLHLYGEHEFEVPPLALPDPALVRELDRLSQYEAVALFIDRARSVDNDFALTTQSALTVAEICMRLDGLPLAIELAAVRVKVLSLKEILAPRAPAPASHRRPAPRSGAAADAQRHHRVEP